MTDKEINHCIAELCGWTEIHDSGIWHNFKPWGCPPEKPGQGGNSYNFLPDYCTDLNAMHEAEATLSQTNMFVMAHYIEQLVNKNGLFYFHATARQRAEAFLKTLGKWEEARND
jgi:hypothetical protein